MLNGLSGKPNFKKLGKDGGMEKLDGSKHMDQLLDNNEFLTYAVLQNISNVTQWQYLHIYSYIC